MQATAVLSNRKLLLWLAALAALPARAATDLTDLKLEDLLQLTVVGASKYEQKQSEVAAAVSIITREEIRAFGWRTLAEALSSLPGVQRSYDRQYSYLGARGFGLPGDLNTRILLTINGNRANNLTFDQAPLGRDFPLDLDLIERIEFIPGPGGAVFGQNAMIGVVNVVTRNGAGIDGGELAAAYQHPQSQREGRVTLGRTLDNGVDVLISASGMRARGQDLDLDFGESGVSGTARGLDGEYDRQLFARVSAGAWSFDFIDGDHRKDDPTGAYRSDPLVPGQYQADRYKLGQLQYQDSFREDTLHVLARLFAGEEDYRSNFSFGTPYQSPATSDWYGLELRLLSTAVAGHKLMLGVEAQDNAHYDQAQINLVNPATSIYIPRSGFRAGVYAQDEWHLADALTATLGVRVDENNVTSSKVSPRAALIWTASPATTLKALYGRAYRAPNAYERDYYDGVTQVANPRLTGESIDTLELVADHRVDRDMSVRASIYEWKLPSLITLGVDPASGLAQFQPGTRVNAHGLELSLDKTWDWGGRLRSSIAFQHVSEGVGGPPPDSPTLLGKLNFSAPIPRTGARIGWEMQSYSQRDTAEGAIAAGFVLANLVVTADHWLSKSLDVSLGIYNIFDRQFADPVAYINWQDVIQQDGRTVRAKMSYRF